MSQSFQIMTVIALVLKSSTWDNTEPPLLQEGNRQSRTEEEVTDQVPFKKQYDT